MGIFFPRAENKVWNMDTARGRFGLNFQPWVSVFNLCNAVVGAGVLAFPFAFRSSFLYFSFPCTVTLDGIKIYNIMRLQFETRKIQLEKETDTI